MSDDELEKLAMALKNISPSKNTRKDGIAAAMEAFDAEFNTENETASQGLAAQPRPTGQSTGIGSVWTLGRDAMRKLKDIFSFNGKTAMMMGTCAAALFVTSLYLPNTRFEDMPKAPQAVTAEVKADDKVAELEADIGASESITVTGKRADVSEPVEQEEPSELQVVEIPPSPVIVAAPKDTVDKTAPSAKPAPEAQGGINSVSDLLNKVRTDGATAQPETRDREAKFRQRRDEQARLMAESRGALSAPAQTSDADAKAQAQAQSPQGIISQNNFMAPVIGQQAVQPLPTRTEQVGGYILEEVPAEYKTELKTIVTKEASTELVTIPPSYETVTEIVVVKPQSVEYVDIPAEYEWVEGEIEGSTTEYITAPSEYRTIQEAVVVQEASTELVIIPPVYNPDGTILTPASTQERVIPAVTKMQTRRVIERAGGTIERVVPYEIKDGKTRVPVKPEKTIEKVVPAVTKEVFRRVVKTPASTQERVVPAGVRKKVNVRTVLSPQKFYLRDETGQIIREFDSRDQFEKYKSNLTTVVAEKPVSTFSVDVDTASYSFFRSSINRGQLPPSSSIRLEEMINYFPYDYEAPRSADEPFKANVTVTPNPWNADTKLMHIGIKGYVPEMDEKPRSNIVFLIDTSGSMRQENKLPLLISSFKLLLSTLDEDDTVSIVTYAGSAGTVLEPTAASDKNKIKEALNNLRAGGSTAGAAGLELAYNKAMESFDADGVNRVILATDGDFNVGFSSHEEMKTFIEKKRETGIFLSVLGFGNGNYNDQLMQALAQNGNGVAAYIDTLAEANKVLANEAGSALITIAKDVKIQVEFNPETISEYRLIGYETRALKREDFNNDKVDAGEINAGHTVTAIYELTPVGSPARMNDPLRYVTDKLEGKTNGSDEFAFVKIRHKLPSSDISTLQTFPIGPKQERSLNRASDDMRFAVAVAAVGQKLRGDTHLDDFSYAEAIKLASDAKGEDQNGYRGEFIRLVKLVDGLRE